MADATQVEYVNIKIITETASGEKTVQEFFKCTNPQWASIQDDAPPFPIVAVEFSFSPEKNEEGRVMETRNA